MNLHFADGEWWLDATEDNDDKPSKETRTKQQILDDLEQQTMIVAGELAIAKIGYQPRVLMMEDCLGEIIKGILELKQLEGIPSNLKLIEGETK